MLERLLDGWPTRKGLAVYLLVVGAAVLAFVPVFLPLESRLQSAGHGMVAFELAPDPDQVDRILDAWSAGYVIDDALVYEEVDFAFLVAYSLCLAGLVLWAARRDEGAWRARGFALVPWCFAAGLFDAIENVLGIVTLHLNRGDPARAGAGALFALAKFTIVAMAVAYVLRGGWRAIARR